MLLYKKARYLKSLMRTFHVTAVVCITAVRNCRCKEGNEKKTLRRGERFAFSVLVLYRRPGLRRTQQSPLPLFFCYQYVALSQLPIAHVHALCACWAAAVR